MAVTRAQSKSKTQVTRLVTTTVGVTTRSRARQHQTVNHQKKEAKTATTRNPKARNLTLATKATKQKFVVGEVVYAKLSGFAPWPGFVKEILFQKTYLIEFFGDNTEQFFPIQSLTKFIGNEKIGEAQKKRKGYGKALEEAKRVCEKAKK